MSSEEQPSQNPTADENSETASAAAAASAAVSVLAVELEGDDPLRANYGQIPLEDLQSNEISGRTWTMVKDLTDELKDKWVLIRGRAHTIRAVGKNTAFIVVRKRGLTVQCVLTVEQDLVSSEMVKFATSLNRESIVDIEGVVSVPARPIISASQQVEIQVRKLYCVNMSVPRLPFNIDDAARSEVDIEKSRSEDDIEKSVPFNIDDAARSEVDIEKSVQKKKKKKPFVRVNQDTRLNHRVLDVRTPANQAIFSIQSQVGNIFRQFLLSEDFFEIHTPKIIAGASEGGSAVFRLDYKGTPACLAQSPQLHKQMSILCDLYCVFEISVVFRAEDSFTHRHLCEFISLDVEMEINKHYSEVMDIVDRLFVTMFDILNEKCAKELEAINKQYPFEPLKYLRNTLRLTFAEGVQMLQEAGVEVDPLGDLNTELERKLGQLVLEKYGTEFYILHRYPLAVRPFYTMPCHDDANYSNSFDVFIRGQEIISGAQRVHVPEILTERAQALGIDVNTISSYIDSFRYGAPPHGGFGVGLERVVMLFCALKNILQTSLFPRDPHRIAP